MSAATDNRSSMGEGCGLELAQFANEWNGPIAASTHLYAGTLSGVLTSDTTTNYPGMKSFVGDGTMYVRGFVEGEVDNSSGAKGARPCRVRARSGTLVDLNAGGGSAIAMPADYLKPIYGVDNQTCSKLVADSAVCIGLLVGMDPATGYPVVFVSPLIAKLLTVMASTGIVFTQTFSTTTATVPVVTTHAITDSSGGAVSTSALASITTGGGTYPDATPTKNAIATLAAESELLKADVLANRKLINKLVDTLQAAGIAG